MVRRGAIGRTVRENLAATIAVAGRFRRWSLSLDSGTKLVRRSTKWLVGLTAVAVIALLLVVAGPKSSESGGCLFCGRTRYEAWMFGVKISDRVRENEASAWVDGMHPGHTNHLWGTSSVMHKGWGFRAVIGCGGVGAGGVAQICLLRTEFGEARAREFLDKYHSRLNVDRDSLGKILQTEFNTLITK
jgi:hypothetical protein